MLVDVSLCELMTMVAGLLDEPDESRLDDTNVSLSSSSSSTSSSPYFSDFSSSTSSIYSASPSCAPTFVSLEVCGNIFASDSFLALKSKVVLF